MITFKRFLSEEAKNLRELLIRDCAPFLKEADGSGFLIRGMKPGEATRREIPDMEGEPVIYMEKSVRTDRKPLNTNERVHKIMDDWFLRKAGFRARSNGLFVFGDQMRTRTVQEYGPIRIIFPIGPIKYVWSPKIDDLFVRLPSKMDKIEDREAQEDAVTEFLVQGGYKTTDLDEAILASKQEIMLGCSKYYAFNTDYLGTLEAALKDYMP